MATCRSCRSDIWWAYTPNGKPIPIDATPDPRGNIAEVPVADVGDAGFRQVVVYGPDDARRRRDDGVTLYVSHFVTCRQADEWRTR